MQDFSKFGEIGDFYRPVLLHKHQNSTVAFVRYKREEDGRRAEEAMNGKMLEDNEIVVCQAIQPVFFTHDTGYLTNYELNVPPREAEEFDSSLPENHYDMKRKEELKATDKYYTVRVDDLHPAIR